MFPFSDEAGSLHDTCTATDDAYGEEWCATQTDQDHSVIEWGHCSPECQDIGDREETGDMGLDGGETNIIVHK